MHPADEDLELYFLLRLSPTLISSIESHILECEICREKVQRLSASLHERRRAAERFHDVRVSLEGGLSIRILEGPAIPGRIVHISEDEMVLGVSEPLLPGIFVQIRIGPRIVMGQVTHCAPAQREFHVTFEIQSVFLIPRRESLGEDPGTGDT